VQLSDIYVEGLVHITALKNDYYQFDPVRQLLRGEHSGVTYHLGDSVMVKVVRVDLDERKIDLQLLDAEGVNVGADNRPRGARAPGGKGAGKGAGAGKGSGKGAGKGSGKGAGRGAAKGAGKGAGKEKAAAKPARGAASASKSAKPGAGKPKPAKAKAAKSAGAAAGTLTGTARRDAILAAAPIVNKAKAPKQGKAAAKPAAKKPNAKPKSR
jgi:ribonuclease R